MMIRRLKFKFVITALIALLSLLLVIVFAMNILNFNSVKKQADDILSLLSNNRGSFPELEDEGKPAPLPPSMSPETPHENRFFSVVLDEFCEVTSIDTSKISSVDDETAKDYAKRAIEMGGERGFIGEFRFARSEEDGSLRITFLDMGRRLDAFRGFLFVSLVVALCAFIIISIVVILISGRIIKPIAESYEKQKRFITDAGHEIKTPLTIIGANVDVLAMDIGSHESLDDISKQIERLRNLTNDLIYLARMEEDGRRAEKIELPISEVVRDSASAFIPLLATNGKTLTLDIQPLLSARADVKAIEQLIVILMDNANKYSPNGSAISLSLCKHGRAITLTVKNKTTETLRESELNKIFDRFYRADLSRGGAVAGHGIGLSLAKAIVTSHGGKIYAELEDEAFKITATIPV